MIFIIALVVVVAFGGAFILGRAGAANASTPTISVPQGDSSSKDCDQNCIEWDNARSMSCNAKNDEAAARAMADSIRAQLAVAIGTAATLGAAAAATFVAAAAATATIFGIPAGIVLTGIAIGLAATAAAALLLAAGFTGALTAADSDLVAKTRARAAWDAEVARLRALINANCPPDKANACLSRPGPC